MMTHKQYIQAAFAALLEGNTAKRDFYCAMADNLANASKRKTAGYPAEEVVAVGAKIEVRKDKP